MHLKLPKEEAANKGDHPKQDEGLKNPQNREPIGL